VSWGSGNAGVSRNKLRQSGAPGPGCQAEVSIRPDSWNPSMVYFSLTSGRVFRLPEFIATHACISEPMTRTQRSFIMHFFPNFSLASSCCPRQSFSAPGDQVPRPRAFLSGSRPHIGWSKARIGHHRRRFLAGAPWAVSGGNFSRSYRGNSSAGISGWSSQ